MLSEDEVTTRAAYDVMAQQYAGTFPDLSAEAPEDRDLIDRFADQVRGTGWVLDAGCGTGRLAAHLCESGVQMIGMDLSEGMLAQARRRHPTLPLLGGSLTAVPLADAAACGLVAWYSIIHTAPEQLPRVCAELARVLVDGAPALLAFQCGDGERLDRTSAFGVQVRRTNYRHRVHEVTEVLGRHGIAVQDAIVRAPLTAFETTPQAFVVGVRRPGE